MAQSGRRLYRVAGGPRPLTVQRRDALRVPLLELPGPDPHEIHLKMRRSFRPDRYSLGGLKGEPGR